MLYIRKIGFKTDVFKLKKKKQTKKYTLQNYFAMIATYIELNYNHFSLTLVGTFAKIKVVFTCCNKSRALKIKFIPHSENIDGFFSKQNMFFLLLSNLH